MIPLIFDQASNYELVIDCCLVHMRLDKKDQVLYYFKSDSVLVRRELILGFHNRMQPYYIRCSMKDKVYLVKLFGICSYVAVGSLCLVRDDDIWYDATIMEILDDAQFHIQFKANHHTKTVSVKDLFPLSKSLILS